MPSRPTGVAGGEVVFNTVMTGYQEVITDPSYAGQIITFTYPHIGNYGSNDADLESARPFCRGVIVRDMARRFSNHRAEHSLDAMLLQHGVSGIGGIDTRRLDQDPARYRSDAGAFGTADEATLRRAAAAETGTDGIDLVADVTCESPYTVAADVRSRRRRIVAFDFGIKRTMLRHLAGLGTVEVVPARTTAAEVLASNPDGVFLSERSGRSGHGRLRHRHHRRAARSRYRSSASASVINC